MTSKFSTFFYSDTPWKKWFSYGKKKGYHRLRVKSLMLSLIDIGLGELVEDTIREHVCSIARFDSRWEIDKL